MTQKVWSKRRRSQTAPMAWFVGGLVLVWYASYGVHEEQAEMAAPWYTTKKSPTFSDLLATLRLHLWEATGENRHPRGAERRTDWLFHYISTSTG